MGKFFDQLLLSFVRIDYFLLNSILRTARLLLYTDPDPAKVHKLLLVRKGNLGDIVCSLPAFEAIRTRFSKATIDVLTTFGNQSTLGINDIIPGYFNEVIEYTTFSQRDLVAKIKRAGYDAVIELPPDVDTWMNQMRNLLFFRMAGIQAGFGWTVTNTLYLRKIQAKYMSFPNEQERLRQILLRNGIDALSSSEPKLFSLRDSGTVGAKFPEILLPGKQRVAVAPGAKLERKQWPMASFKATVDEILTRGFDVYILGDVNDAALTSTWQHDRLFNTCGQLTVNESAALLSTCELTLCNDSGPMHLSYSSGTPVLALFSARNYPGKWNPPDDGKNKMLIDYNVPCAICRDRVCHSNICMQSITPTQVLALFDEMMKTV